MPPLVFTSVRLVLLFIQRPCSEIGASFSEKVVEYVANDEEDEELCELLDELLEDDELDWLLDEELLLLD
jgi:hypothetical protein